MTIAQKLTTAAENMPKVFDAGKSWVFAHMSRPNGLFYKTAFPAGSSLNISLTSTNGTLTEMFRLTTGLERLEITVPDFPCKVNYFLYSSAIRVLRLNGDLRASDFTNFAARCSALEEIHGTIDLTDSTDNENCFGSCPLLREVRFAPGSIHKSVCFKQSALLSADSVASIVAGLATVEETQNLELHNTVEATLTPTQRAQITAKNWQLL